MTKVAEVLALIFWHVFDPVLLFSFEELLFLFDEAFGFFDGGGLPEGGRV